MAQTSTEIVNPCQKIVDRDHAFLHDPLVLKTHASRIKDPFFRHKCAISLLTFHTTLISLCDKDQNLLFLNCLSLYNSQGEGGMILKRLR